MNKVYVRLDGNKIVKVNSDEFIHDLSGWVQIDEGEGDKYHHAQNHYFPLPIKDFDNGKYRYGWDGAKVIELDTVPTFEEQKEIKKASIAQARYEAEIAGVDGIRTDRESQSLITGAVVKAIQDPDYTCRWKGIDGFVTLSAPQIITVADTVRAHVQGCFDKEDELLAQIESATTQAELDSINW